MVRFTRELNRNVVIVLKNIVECFIDLVLINNSVKKHCAEPNAETKSNSNN